MQLCAIDTIHSLKEIRFACSIQLYARLACHSVSSNMRMLPNVSGKTMNWMVDTRATQSMHICNNA